MASAQARLLPPRLAILTFAGSNELATTYEHRPNLILRRAAHSAGCNLGDLDDCICSLPLDRQEQESGSTLALGSARSASLARDFVVCLGELEAWKVIGRANSISLPKVPEARPKSTTEPADMRTMQSSPVRSGNRFVQRRGK